MITLELSDEEVRIIAAWGGFCHYDIILSEEDDPVSYSLLRRLMSLAGWTEVDQDTKDWYSEVTRERGRKH